MRRCITAAALLVMVMSVPACSTRSDGAVATLSIEATDLAAGEVRIDAPATIDGGVVRIVFKNEGRQAHDAQLARLDGTHTEEELLAVLDSEQTPIPDWVSLEGGVGVTSPKASRAATVKLTPGEYFIFDSQSGENGAAFAQRGGIRPLSVKPGNGGDLEPAGSVIVAEDYRFTVPPLDAGTTDITFQNAGQQPHLFVAAPLAPGKSIEDVKAAFSDGEAPATGPPPIDFTKATTVAALDGAKSLTTTLSLENGNYVFICFLSDRGGGPRHFALGMLQQSDVT